MKKMRKWFCSLMSTVMLLSYTACNQPETLAESEKTNDVSLAESLGAEATDNSQAPTDTVSADNSVEISDITSLTDTPPDSGSDSAEQQESSSETQNTETNNPATSQTQSSTASTSVSQTEKKKTLSTKEIGYIYNLFYIALLELPGDIGDYGGWISDYNQDGIDDLIIQYFNYDGGYIIYTYKNGALKKETKSNIDVSALRQSTYYLAETLPSFLLSSAHNYGFKVNSNKEYNGYTFRGYVKTKGIDSNLNLRSKPSTSSQIVTKLPNGLLFGSDSCYNSSGQQIDEYADEDEISWLKIETWYNDQYYEGYVSTEYVHYWMAGI